MLFYLNTENSNKLSRARFDIEGLFHTFQEMGPFFMILERLDVIRFNLMSVMASTKGKFSVMLG